MPPSRWISASRWQHLARMPRYSCDPCSTRRAPSPTDPTCAHRRWRGWPSPSRTCSTSPARPRGRLADAGRCAPCHADCPAVARLRARAAAIIGRTNMTEFAFSGVGINPHFGTPANAASRDEPLIPGGLVLGRGRVGGHRRGLHRPGIGYRGLDPDPGSLNGIVGFKNTARLVPIAGRRSLSTTLDTVCADTLGRRRHRWRTKSSRRAR
jgi:hypothetical protein